MTDLDSLIARVERLDKPDREVDALIGAYVNGGNPSGFSGWYWTKGQGRHEKADRFTASTDAILDLIERRLPGQWADLIRDALKDMGARFAWHTAGRDPEHFRLFPKFLVLAFLHELKEQTP